MRRLSTVTTSAAAIAAVAGSLAFAAPASAATKLPRCTVGVLTLTHTAADIGAGNGYENLVFTNKGAKACFLVGHPGVSYVKAKGKQVGASATRVGKAHTVILKPGGKAVAQLHFVNIVDAVLGCDKPSEQRKVLGERVYPPGSTKAMYVKDPHVGCITASAHLLSIGAVVTP
ncbi:DUF4232 domain-containing protein [Acidothermaceae bacterium B102]|nr:DUF4232 domain-containing protein [Acidothermaceae bacterium B102]